MIEFRMNDWRTNASIRGLVEILEFSGDAYKKSEDGLSISIDESVLDGFEEKYFAYFIDRYEKELPWYRISSYKKSIGKYTDEFMEDDLEEINNQIDLVKDYMTRPNYTKVYEYIDDSYDIESRIKELKKIKLRKKENIEDRYDEIKEQVDLLKEITEYSNKEGSKKHMGAKGVIYSHINRGIGGVSFLNMQTKETNVYKDYKKYFLDPLLEFLEEDKGKKPYECFNCGGKIKTIGDASTINMVNMTGFDETRKSSYVWGHMSDILICKKCSFLYTMLPAGFNYSAYEGIYINYNRDIDGLVDVNKHARSNMEGFIGQDGKNNKAISYRTIVEAVGVQHRRQLDYEKKDIQIIRYKDEEYKFNLLSNETIEIIQKSKSDLDAIIRASYKQGNDYFNIYDLVLDRIFNNQNMFTLIHYLLVNAISENPFVEKYYNIYHIGRILNINNKLLKGGSEMDREMMRKQIYFSREDGNRLRKIYKQEGNENKLNGISYRLLNALKTGNSHNFVHNIVNSYMYIGEPVPKSISSALEDEDRLKNLGYAFVIGLNGGENKYKLEEEEGDEKDEK